MKLQDDTHDEKQTSHMIPSSSIWCGPNRETFTQQQEPKPRLLMRVDNGWRDSVSTHCPSRGGFVGAWFHEASRAKPVGLDPPVLS